MLPNSAPATRERPVAAQTALALNAPVRARAANGPGSVRLGVEGNLSAMASPMASATMVATPPQEAKALNGCLSERTAPRRAAMLKAAGPENERIPQTAPATIAEAYTRELVIQDRDAVR